MAFSPLDAGRLFRTALATISGSGRTRGQYSLARQLQRSFPNVPGGSFAAWFGLAGRAVRAVEAGKRVARTAVNTVRRALIPVDPSILAGDPRYRYRVLVTAENGTGGTVSYAVDINSDSLMSLDQIRAAAAENFEGGGSPRRSTRKAIGALGANPTLTFQILSAGRRG